MALQKDIENLSALWQEVFDESEKVTDLFFKNVYPTCENPTLKKDGKIVSSAFLIPCEIENYKGLYVYCSMTHKDYRGKGLMGSILKEADEIKAQNNLDFLILVPASESLFDFYSKFGYENFGYSFKLSEPKSYEILTDKYSSVRKFNGTELKFSNDVLDYWAKATKIYGGCVIDVMGSACLLGEGKVLDAKCGTRLTNTAMIKTEIEKLKNTQTFIGITLE